MFRKRLEAALVTGTEMILAVGLVLVFFLALTGILMLSFPRGSGLRSLYDDLVVERQTRAGLDLSDSAEQRGVELIARLTEVTRRVKDRPSDAVVWRDASAGMRLENRHAIQTLDRSAASIVFDEQSVLRLGENALVVIRGAQRKWGRATRRTSLVVIGGEVRGSVGGGDAVELELVTNNAATRIAAEGDREAQFALAVNPDQTSTVSVFSGKAEVASGGKTTVVRSNQTLEIDATGESGELLDLPDAPALTSPRHRSERVYSTIVPEVTFRWSSTSDAEGYRLDIARDAAFGDTVHSTAVAGTEFVHGNLQPGRYYWRVTGLSGRAQGRPGDVRVFDMVQDVDPPQLRVDLPREIRSATLQIRGTAEPGAEVLIGNEQIPTKADGEFEYEVTLKHGLNMVVVEAIDAAGNSSYHSQYVNAKY